MNNLSVAAFAGPAHFSLATLAIAALLLALAACGDATPPPAPNSITTTTAGRVVRPTDPVDELVAVGGARLHVRCAGRGDITVVLLSGFEDPGDSWDAITPAIEPDARVCTYSRFGTGTSDPPPATQTFSTQATDLRALLRSIGDPGPYLLVGHSYGGAEAVSFAAAFPNDVSGVLLLDASPVTWAATTCSVPDDGSDAAHSFRLACAMNSDAGDNAEHLDGAASFAEVADIESLGSLPMVVATAATREYPGLAPSEVARLTDVWNEGQEHWAALSDAARLLRVEHTGHYIQTDQPDIVLEQIRELLG